MSNYHRNSNRMDRVDQDEVPESKHTVFIRGLPGSMKTDEVKDFFEDHIGTCSFDFIKVSPDQQKLFVAVRFETREAAKECMNRYRDREILGYPIEMTWFRDIRRYMSYQQSQGQGARPANPPRNRYGSNRNYNNTGRSNYDHSSRNEYRDDEYEVTKSGTSKNPRSFSKSSSSSRSRSPHRSSREQSDLSSSHRYDTSAKRSRRSFDGSVSPDRNRSVSPHGIEKGSTPPLPPSPAPVSSVLQKSQSKSVSPASERKNRKAKKDKKKKRKRSPSTSTVSGSEPDYSTEELSEEELRRKILGKRQKSLREGTGEETKANGIQFAKVEVDATSASRSESTVLQNTTLKFGLEGNEDIPKRIVKESSPSTQLRKSSASFSKNADNLMARPGKVDTSGTGFSAKSPVTAFDSRISSAKSGISFPSAAYGSSVDTLLGKRSALVTASTSGLLDDVKLPVALGPLRGQQSFTPKKAVFDELDDPVQTSCLRLSSLTRQITAETERERKLASLTPELRTKFISKKKQFDASLKGDCETFAFVVKMLLEKDPGLEDRLRPALAEVVKDMEDKFSEKMDHYLDQLLSLLSPV